MADALPFDAVLFDLDGTLVATDRFWPEAADAGARRAFRELGIERALPQRADWMGMVGLPLAEGFARVFGDLGEPERALVMALCVEEERSGGRAVRAALLPGVRATLEELAAHGLRRGVASNCTSHYLRSMLDGLGLARWIEEARCLDSPGVATKADMVEDLLHTFGTRRAVMVGDHMVDRDAAWANGLPYVQLARGYGFAASERFDCEATIEGMDELVPLLRTRGALLARLAAEIVLPGRGAVVGVTGPPLAGKTLFALELARSFEDMGRAARVVALDDFAWTGVTGGGFAIGGAAADPPRGRRAGTQDDPLDAGWELGRLERELLEPHRAGRRPIHGGEPLSAETVLVLEGPFLVHPRLLPAFDALVALEASDELVLRRAAGRDGRLAGPAPVARVRTELLPVQRAFDARYPARAAGALVVCVDNLLTLA